MKMEPLIVPFGGIDPHKQKVFRVCLYNRLVSAESTANSPTLMP